MSAVQGSFVNIVNENIPNQEIKKMAWTNVKWACGHSGEIQLYGKCSARDAEVGRQAAKKCMACWMVNKWDEEGDPRSQSEDRYILARDIASNKGIRIFNLPKKINQIKAIDKSKLSEHCQKHLSIAEEIVMKKSRLTVDEWVKVAEALAQANKNGELEPIQGELK